MKIGIDGIPLGGNKTGVGHYTFEIAHGLAALLPAEEIQVLSHVPYEAGAINTNSGLANLHFIKPKVNSFTKHWWTIGLPRYIRRNRINLFHGTNYDIPVWGGCPTVLTIHDLSSFLFAETHVQRRVRRARRRLPTMARLATRIIVPTESVRTEVVENLRVSDDKVSVIHEAPRRCFFPQSRDSAELVLKQLEIEEPFILYVGTIEPRKNVLTLVKAFEEIYRKTEHRPQLVIAGPKGWLSDDLYAHVERSAVKNRLLLTGYLGDEDLRALYSTCSVLSYPALYEGAGLPPLEAMACGAPVVTTDARAISEMVGNAALRLPAKDYEALAKNLLELLIDERAKKELSERGLKHVAQFTWDRAVAATYEVYLEALQVRTTTR
jgi:glycosyltransferase involved in cell wall biosynthesis